MKRLKLTLLLFAIISFSFVFVACGRIEKNDSKIMTNAAQRINPTVHVTLKNDRTYFENEVISRNELKIAQNDTLGILSVRENLILKVGENIVHWVFTPTDQTTYRILEGDLTVVAVKIVPVDVSVQTMPKKIGGYVAYDEFDQTGMALKVTYNNGGIRFVTNKSDWTIFYQSENNYFLAGENKVTVSCVGCTTEIALNESVEKFKVQIPDIKTKIYNGQNQTAEILANENAKDNKYFSLTDFSAKNVGSHSVTIILNDFANCMWSDNTNSKNLSVNFVIEKAYRDVSVRPVYSLWTGDALNIPQNYVVIEDYESKSMGEVAKTTFTYFVDEEGLIKTTTANSGSDEEGGAPRNLGDYYVKVSYLGDENYHVSESKISLFKIVENDTDLFDLENSFGWRYLNPGENTKDLPFIRFESKIIDGLKVLYLKLIENESYPMLFKNGIVYYFDSTNFMIYDNDGNEIQMQLKNNQIKFKTRNDFEFIDEFIFEKWSVPAYVGNYECDRSVFGGQIDTLKITAEDGEIYFALKYSYRSDELSTDIAGTDEVEGYIAFNNENNLQFYTVDEFGEKELISSVHIEDVNNPQTTFVLLLGPNYQEEFNFVKIA